MKKIIIGISIFILLFSVNSPTFITNASAAKFENSIVKDSKHIIYEDDTYLFEFEEYTDAYKKMKITNILTDEVEYLEITSKGDSTDFLSLDYNENPVYQISYNDIDHTGTQKIFETGETKDLFAGSAKTLTLNEPTSDAVSPLALPGGNGDYVLYGSFKYNQDITVATVSAITALVITIVYRGLPQNTPIDDVIYAAAAGIALLYYSITAPKIYYIQEIYLWHDYLSKPAAWVRYYKYHDYSGFIDATFVKVNH